MSDELPKEDFSELTFKELHTVASSGNPEAQFLLANRYIQRYSSKNREPDDASLAFTWYAAAATQSHVGAQYRLGLAFYKGEGTAENSYEAARWFHKAAEQGNVWAQFRYGECLRLGMGVVVDLIAAEKWLAKAAEQGHQVAKANLKHVSNQIGLQNTHAKEAEPIEIEISRQVRSPSLDAAKLNLSSSSESNPTLEADTIKESYTHQVGEERKNHESESITEKPEETWAEHSRKVNNALEDLERWQTEFNKREAISLGLDPNDPSALDKWWERQRAAEEERADSDRQMEEQRKKWEAEAVKDAEYRKRRSEEWSMLNPKSWEQDWPGMLFILLFVIWFLALLVRG